MPPRTTNKSAFVRELGDIPAKAVVEKAAARGIKLSVAYVHTIRSNANRKARSGSTGRAAKRWRPSTARPSSGLRTTIDRLTKEFVEGILRALRGASLEDVIGAG